MEEFKVGGKITLEDNEVYRIVDILRENGKDYLFCCTTKKPIIPKLLEQKKINGEVFVREEDNLEILKKIATRIISEEKQENEE